MTYAPNRHVAHLMTVWHVPEVLWCVEHCAEQVESRGLQEHSSNQLGHLKGGCIDKTNWDSNSLSVVSAKARSHLLSRHLDLALVCKIQRQVFCLVHQLHDSLLVHCQLSALS